MTEPSSAVGSSVGQNMDKCNHLLALNGRMQLGILVVSFKTELLKYGLKMTSFKRYVHFQSILYTSTVPFQTNHNTETTLCFVSEGTLEEFETLHVLPVQTLADLLLSLCTRYCVYDQNRSWTHSERGFDYSHCTYILIRHCIYVFNMLTYNLAKEPRGVPRRGPGLKRNGSHSLSGLPVNLAPKSNASE